MKSVYIFVEINKTEYKNQTRHNLLKLKLLFQIIPNYLRKKH